MYGLRGAWHFPQRVPHKARRRLWSRSSGRALAKVDPEATVASKAHEICPHRLITLTASTSDLRPRAVLAALPPSTPHLAGTQQMGVEGLCGPGHVLSAPKAQKPVLFTPQTSREDLPCASTEPDTEGSDQSWDMLPARDHEFPTLCSNTGPANQKARSWGRMRRGSLF